ncbi:hypothetical protein BH11PSE9_BH11PSE9_19090 [soil metagenome]
MNMNTTSRLDDKFNSFLIAVAVALAFGAGFHVFAGDALGPDGTVARQFAQAEAQLQMVVAQVAVNTTPR